MRPLVTIAAFLAAWFLFTAFAGVPAYMLPGPAAVAAALWAQPAFLFTNALTTLAEILAGLAGGTVLGAAAAIAITMSQRLGRWLLPVLVLSQAIPVFALAPLLVLWLGFGILSKIVMAMLIIFFPVTAAFADGLRRTEPGWLDLARTMNASKFRVMWRIRIPAALPAFASGLRVATAIAPIGAVLGEWMGASSGLGYVMVEANARIQTDIMFAALTILITISLTLWVIVDRTLRRVLYWVPDQGSAA